MKTVIGIDFGTSTTVVAKRTESSRFEPEIIEIDGKKTTDTVIRLNANGDRIESIGQDAWSAAEQYASTTFYEFKPHVGKGVSYPLPGGTHISAEDLAVRFLGRVREAIENFYGKSEMEARNTITIIGYPADWPEKQKDAIVKAAKDAGFPNVEGCIEPLAVLYYHHSRGDLDLNKPQKILVYDLGGGTTDTCLVEVTSLDQLPKVLGTGGEDTGGRHFDSAIANNITHVICQEERLQALSPEDTITIRKSGRTLKEKISDEARHGHNDFKYTVPPLLSTGRTFKLNIAKTNFEKICETHIKKLNIPIDEVLKRSAVEPSKIDRVVIAGGMGRLYFIRPDVEHRFPHLKEKGITTSTNPQEVVAKGLVLFGLQKQGIFLTQAQEDKSQRKYNSTVFFNQKIQNKSENYIQRNKKRFVIILTVLVFLYAGYKFLGMGNLVGNSNSSVIDKQNSQQKFSSDELYKIKAAKMAALSAQHHFAGLGGPIPTENDRNKQRLNAERLYLGELENVNLSGCPAPFQAIFKAYREDRRSLIKYLDDARDGYFSKADVNSINKFKQQVEQVKKSYVQMTTFAS
jgi:molecular chaperone DnaK (HSP70)